MSDVYSINANRVNMLKRALKVTPDHLKTRKDFYLVPHYADKIYGTLTKPPARVFTRWLSLETIRDVNQSFREYYPSESYKEAAILVDDEARTMSEASDETVLESEPHFLDH